MANIFKKIAKIFPSSTYFYATAAVVSVTSIVGTAAAVVHTTPGSIKKVSCCARVAVAVGAVYASARLTFYIAAFQVRGFSYEFFTAITFTKPFWVLAALHHFKNDKVAKPLSCNIDKFIRMLATARDVNYRFSSSGSISQSLTGSNDFGAAVALAAPFAVFAAVY